MTKVSGVNIPQKKTGTEPKALYPNNPNYAVKNFINTLYLSFLLKALLGTEVDFMTKIGDVKIFSKKQGFKTKNFLHKYLPNSLHRAFTYFPDSFSRKSLIWDGG